MVCDGSEVVQLIYIADSYNHKVISLNIILSAIINVFIRLNRLILSVRIAPHWLVLAKPAFKMAVSQKLGSQNQEDCVYRVTNCILQILTITA